jgi:hypothetical protein
MAWSERRVPFVRHILRFIEEGNRSDLYNDNLDWHAQPAANRPALYGAISVYNCPSDRPSVNSNFNAQFGNYGVNWGPLTFVVANRKRSQEGPFFIKYGARLADVTDGTSNTMAMMEMLQATTPASDNRGLIWNDDAGSYMLMANTGPNSRAGDGVFYCVDEPESNLPCAKMASNYKPDMFMAARSKHPGGVQVVLCDASVQFVSETIDLNVWRAASTQAGSESLSLQ